MDTVTLLWFGRSPILPPRYEKASLRVLDERLTILMNMDYSERYNNRIYMKYWNFWKASYILLKQFFLSGSIFVVYFFDSSFYLLFPDTSLHCATLAEVRYIPELESWFFLVVTQFSNITLFCCSIVIYHLLIYLIGMKVILLTASCTEVQRTMLLDNFWLPFARRTTIGTLVLVSCTSICATVWHDILFISSALTPEDTWIEAAHAWVFVVK